MRLHALSIAALMTLFALPARAQDAANQAAAEALFDQGKAAMAAHDYAAACPKFFESNRLDTGIGTSLWLAECYEKNGQTASAWAQFREAAALAVKASDPREKVARARARSLEARLAHLVLVVPPSVAATPSLRIARDGSEVPEALWGTAIPIDPGPHTVVVSAPDHRPATLSIDIRRGPGKQTLDVPVLEDAPAPPPLPEASSAEPPREAPPRETPGFPVQRAVAVGVVVVGVGAVAAASFFGLHAKSELDASNAGPCMPNNRCNATGLVDRSSAESGATASTILFIAGGAALAGGVALWVTAPKRNTSGLATSLVAPWLDPQRGAGGVVLTADF